eukprot:TRINITY_DN31984_c0_g1_i1.p1 TRINITY_DN31984_c0_g1~~TRINITY_DN31984_c0_g1_i1.p1  ORF type:complete len:127 (-),score=15.41 TRINITY_DN31984_c0_g1_i1:103-483(-)
MSKRFFGTPPGVKLFGHFQNRVVLSKAGVHRPPQGGICGTQEDGAESVVLSGGYTDDKDDGEEVVYTGAGGQDNKGNLVKDQELVRGNAALAKSAKTQLPIRVVRGHPLNSEYAPLVGYRQVLRLF